MRVTCTLLLVCSLLSVLFATDSLDEVEAVKTCCLSCSGEHKPECDKGCKFAYALTFAPKDYAHNPSCQEACKDQYPKDVENSACVNGCEHFNGGALSVQLQGDQSNSGLANFFQQRVREMHEQMQNIFGGMMTNQEIADPAKQPGGLSSFIDRKVADMMQRVRSFVSGSPAVQDSDEPVVSTRVRIFFLHRPEEQDTENVKLLQGKGAIMPTVESHSVCQRFLHGVRHVFTNPFNLLLALTLIALALLIVAQIVLFVRRRPRRARGHEYTRLPTYAEAVEIKIPVATLDDQVFMSTEKAKLPDDEPARA